MRVPRHRPLLPAALCLACGIAAGHRLQLNDLHGAAWPWGPVGLLAAVLAVSWWTRRGVPRRLRGALVLLCVAALGLVRVSQERLPIDIYRQKAAYTAALSGLVADYPTRIGPRLAFLLAPDGERGLVQVFVDGAQPSLRVGQRVTVRGAFEPPRPSGGVDYAEQLALRGVWAVVWAGSGDLAVSGAGRSWPWLRWGQDARDALLARIDAHVPAPHNALLAALLLGTRWALDDAVEDAFRDAGVAHVLALSGLHLGILIVLGWRLLRALWLSPGATYAVLAGGVAVYLLLVGPKVSLLRAGLLFAFVAAGHALRGRGRILSVQIDPLQGWALAWLVVLFAHPQGLFEAGFQLSFAATGAILLTTPFLPWLHRRCGLLSNPDAPRGRRPGTRLRARLKAAVGRAALGLVLVSLAAQLGVWPIVALHFHTAYLGTVLANLLVVPWVTLALWGGAVFLLSGWLSPLAGALGSALGAGLSGLTALIAGLAALPGMAVEVPPPPLPLVLAYLGALAGGLLWLQGRLPSPQGGA